LLFSQITERYHSILYSKFKHMKNTYQILALLFFLQLLHINASGQNKIMPFVSVGAMHHLGRAGANIELGGEYEIYKHLGISANYRYSNLWNQFDDKIRINALALNLSWIVINGERNRLSVSTGLNAGNYYSLSINTASVYNPVREKEYYAVWWNPAKIQYDYTFPNKVMLGGYLAWYGDDGDNSNLIGLVLSYKL
jgi:hypothetical protein